MDNEQLKELLQSFKSGKKSIDDTVYSLKNNLSSHHLGHSKLDMHRHLRNGIPEVVFCEHKQAAHLIDIMKAFIEKSGRVLGTRASREQAEAVLEQIPEMSYDPVSKILKYEKRKVKTKRKEYVLIATGGTSDIPVAEEAAQSLEFFGMNVERAYDVGVAGMHRVLDLGDTLYHASVIIAVAGMEGALATVVGGLVSVPVIAVPTSVGYGANFSGISALLAMLNSCAGGVSVVNIDNGYGAATVAYSIINTFVKDEQ